MRGTPQFGKIRSAKVRDYELMIVNVANVSQFCRIRGAVARIVQILSKYCQSRIENRLIEIVDNKIVVKVY